ncbi:hypothetical protein [Enterobacter sp. PTB]|uniref:hypothetical protein n=1 Tax=Enterobacter sp. PTB TaxID=3143437 RepID=UPI003DA7DED3
MGNLTERESYNYLIGEGDLGRLNSVSKSIALISYILEIMSEGKVVGVDVAGLAAITEIINSELQSAIGGVSPGLGFVSYESLRRIILEKTNGVGA